MLDTLNNVKARLNITTTQYDTFLTNQITLVSDTIEAYLRRKVLTTTFTQHFYRTDYCNSRLLELFSYPVQTITSIIEDGGSPIDPTTYRIHKPTGRVLKTDHTYFFGADETVVIYVSGLTTLPTPIKSVLDSVVQERYNKQSSGIDLNFGSDVQRISIPGSISIDFDFTLNNNDRKSDFGVILGNNLNLLDRYRCDRAILGSSKLVYIDEFPGGNP